MKKESELLPPEYVEALVRYCSLPLLLATGTLDTPRTAMAKFRAIMRDEKKSRKGE